MTFPSSLAWWTFESVGADPIAGAVAVTRVFQSMLFGVDATDPVTLAAVTGILATVAFLACYIPARRATRVDPLVALRVE